MHCLVQPHQVIHFLLHIIFIIRIRLWIFKQSTCTLYASEISLFKVFINAWNANWFELFPWCLTFSEFIVSICNRLNFILIINTVSLYLALHWRQNSCPGTTLIFLVFSYWAIWRVITCLSWTLRQCFINTPQHLLSLLSETLPNTCL